MATSPVYADEPVLGNLNLAQGKNFSVTGSSGQIIFSSAVIAANSAGTQAAGTPITAGINHVTSSGGGQSVTLPAAVPGLCITIASATAGNTLKVFPNAGGTGSEQINALAANAAITMAALSSAEFICATAGLWFTVPRVPS